MPIAQANLWMQRDDCWLGDVLVMIGRLFLALREHTTTGAEVVQERWRLEEQPLLILASALHPKYAAHFRKIVSRGSTDRSPARPVLTVSHVVFFAVFYHKVFIGDDTEGLDVAVRKWMLHGVAEERICGPDTLWATLADSDNKGFNKLARLAKFVLSVPAHTADAERMFSEFGYIITKQRNRLHPAKLQQVAQVKRALRKRHVRDHAPVERKRRRIISATELLRKRDRGGNLNEPQTIDLDLVHEGRTVRPLVASWRYRYRYPLYPEYSLRFHSLSSAHSSSSSGRLSPRPSP
eukprot:GHVU01108711.1.p1 GENE.GHVU01108711.1~~GHVU01108711.1.p1  ORF type:complete len:336 (-),score=32.21 GHVU01108711.1:11-892(-)